MHFWTVTILRVVPIFFIACVVIAIPFYPGGNLLDVGQVGYDLSRNYLSELGGIARSQEKAISFRPFSLIWVYSRSYSLVCRFFHPSIIRLSSRCIYLFFYRLHIDGAGVSVICGCGINPL